MRNREWMTKFNIQLYQKDAPEGVLIKFDENCESSAIEIVEQVNHLCKVLHGVAEIRELRIELRGPPGRPDVILEPFWQLRNIKRMIVTGSYFRYNVYDSLIKQLLPNADTWGTFADDRFPCGYILEIYSKS